MPELDLLATVKDARRMLAESGPPRVREHGDFERVSLLREDCDVLRDLFVEARPRVVIEIGLAYGSSALAIAEALVQHDQPDASHVIIDAYQDRFENVGWEAIMAAGPLAICACWCPNDLSWRCHGCLPMASSPMLRS